MKVLYVDKKSHNDFEFKAFDSLDSLDKPNVKCFEVDKIYEDIIEGHRNLPHRLRSMNIMMSTYWGSLVDMYSDYFNITHLKFEDRYFFSTEPNEIIDADPNVPDYKEIYIEEDWNLNPCYTNLIEDYIEYRLQSDGIKIITGDNVYWNSPKGSDEYILNCWSSDHSSKFSYKMVQDVIDKYSTIINKYEELYIPSDGMAETRLGELLRACQRVVYRYFNDGDACNYILDGNLISYLNIPKMIRMWLTQDSESYDYFIDRFNELNQFGRFTMPLDDIDSVFHEQCDGDYAVRLTVCTEVALIETRMKYPDFLIESNVFDSRDWD